MTSSPPSTLAIRSERRALASPILTVSDKVRVSRRFDVDGARENPLGSGPGQAWLRPPSKQSLLDNRRGASSSKAGRGENSRLRVGDRDICVPASFVRRSHRASQDAGALAVASDP